VPRSYITNLRKGRIESPGYEKMRAIAKAMGFAPELWFEEDLGSQEGYREPVGKAAREHPTGKGDAYENSPDRAGNRKSTAVGARRSALPSGSRLSAQAWPRD
jgi:transcriptional regulator with XRE-family HTH domain